MACRKTPGMGKLHISFQDMGSELRTSFSQGNAVGMGKHRISFSEGKIRIYRIYRNPLSYCHSLQHLGNCLVNLESLRLEDLVC